MGIIYLFLCVKIKTEYLGNEKCNVGMFQKVRLPVSYDLLGHGRSCVCACTLVWSIVSVVCCK